MMGRQTIKNRLKIQSAIRDWTQEEFARRVNVTRKTINAVEKGKYVPSTRLAWKLACVFGVAVKEIFQLSGEDRLEFDRFSSEPD